jgi:hypothetical protein
LSGEKLCTAELLKWAAWLNCAVEKSGPPWSDPTNPPPPYTWGTRQIRSPDRVGMLAVLVENAVGHGPCASDEIDDSKRQNRTIPRAFDICVLLT